MHPVRVEFFDDQVESIRSFNASTQRSVGTLTELDLTLIHPYHSDRAHLADYLPANTWVVLLEPSEIQEEARYYLQRVERLKDYHETDEALRGLYRFPSVTTAAIAGGSLEASCNLRFESVEQFSGDFNRVRSELDAAGEGQTIYLVCPTDAEVERYQQLFSGTKLADEKRLRLLKGHLRAGFRIVSKKIALISANELFHRSEATQINHKRLGRVIDSFLDLREGDYVVHLGHGIGKYRGLKMMEKDAASRRASRNRISRRHQSVCPGNQYRAGPKVRRWQQIQANAGNRRWKILAPTKSGRDESGQDLALDMLQLQAMRACKTRHQFSTRHTLAT